MMMGRLVRELEHAFRLLVRSPGFTTVTVSILALGIGASTAIFTIAYGVLLRPLPYPDPDRVVQLWQVNDEGGHASLSDPNFEDLYEQNQSFTALAQYNSRMASVAGGSEPVRAMVAAVSREFFEALGVGPQWGRAFTAEELQENGPPAVIVGSAFWQRYLGGSPDFAGRTLRFDDRIYSIVGVMPPGFSFPLDAELWIPRELFPRLPSRTAHNWHAVGRLRQGVALAQAQADASRIARRLKQEHGERTWMIDAAVVPLHEQLVARVRPALLLLVGAVAFLLAITCANVFNLILARTASRRKELALRLALGASRWRIAERFLAESFLIATAGGALGALLCYWGVDVLLALAPGELPRGEEIQLGLPVLAFVLGLSSAVALGLGLASAARTSGADLQSALKAFPEGRAAGLSRSGLRGLLVAAQVAITFVLLVGAGLLAKSVLLLLSIDPGFRIENVLVMELAHATPDTEEERRSLGRLYEELLERLSAVPGVEAVGGVNSLPLGGGHANGMFLVLAPGEVVASFEDFERLASDPARAGFAEYRSATEGYFSAMGIPLLSGRMFERRDERDSVHVALVSASLAEAKWPGEDPLGKRIEFGNMDGELRPLTVVGVVGDVRHRGLDASAQPTIYTQARQRPPSRFHVVMYGSDPASREALVGSARRILQELDPELPAAFREMEDVFAASLGQRRFTLLLLALFAGAALLLAVLGIYGAMSHAVSRRTREVGVRMAMGARSADVLRLVLGEGARIASAGIAVGVLAAAASGRAVAGLVYEVSATDPWIFLASAFLVIGTALLSCYLPARRAARVDPKDALRCE